MISGFSKPWNPVFIHFIIPKNFITYKKITRTFEKHIIFISDNFGNPFLTFSKRRTPKNDEDPSKNFLIVLNTGPVST